MKEIDLFESWLNSLNESTVLPTNTNAQQQLIKALSEPLPVGADATNAVESLHGIFMTPELSDDLNDLAETDPNADARPVILSKLSDYKSQPGIATVMAKISNATATGDQPAAETPGSEEAVDAAPAAGTAPVTPPAAPVQPEPAATAAPEEQPGAEQEQPVAEDYDYDADLASILKHAGVEPCGCPAEDYVTGDDPHVAEDDADAADGDFTRRELHTILRNAGQLERMIDSGEDLPEWFQSKVSKAGGMLQSVSDYYQTDAEMDAEDDLGLMEGPDYPFDSGSVDEGVIGSTVGGALGSALGPMGTVAGSALGDKAGEWLSKTDMGKKAARWTSDKVGQAATALGGKGAGEMAKGLTSYALAPDSDASTDARTQSGAVGAALGAAGNLPGLAGKIAKGASTVMNLSNRAGMLNKALSAGKTAAELATIPGAATAAQELLSKGGEALSNPATRETLMALAGKGAQALASKKADIGGIRGAAHTAANMGRQAMGAVKSAASSMAAPAPHAVPAMASRGSTVSAPPKTSVAPARTPATGAASSPLQYAQTGNTAASKTSQIVGKAKSLARKMPKMRENSPALAESLNTDVTRLQFLAGIDPNKNKKK